VGFIAEDRLGERGERVKRKVKIILGRGKTWGFAGENGDFSRHHKRRIAGETENGYPSGMAKPSEVWETVSARYLAGEELSAIADDLKLCVETVQTKASRTGLTKLRKQMQTVCKENKSLKTENSIEALSILVRNKLAADAASTLERIEGYDLDGIKDESVRETILGSVAKRSALVFGWSEAGEAASVSINLLGQMPDRITEVQVTGESETK
jgi:hypothetical protein